MLLKKAFTVFLVLYTQSLLGFQLQNDSTQYSHVLTLTQGGITSSKGTLPFWMQGNNSQRFRSGEPNFIYSNLHLRKKISSKENLDYFYGVEWIGSVSGDVSGRFIQNYFGISYSNFLFTFGQKDEFFGNNNNLGFGNLINGNNARPIPKFSIQTRDWLPIFSSFLSVRGYIAHGWFEANRYQSNAFLHQKYLHFKFHPKNVPAEFSFGITHNAQWGGKNIRSNISQPTGFRNFMRILTASKGANDALDTDKLNALGNHLGTWDFQVKVNLGNDWQLANYIQWLWEDGSGLKPKNWNAGIYGFSINQTHKLGVVGELGFELVNTSNQGGSLDGIGSGPDNFLNNSVYRNGWTYNNQIIGSPIFLILNPENKEGNTINNVVKGLSIYSQGHIRNVKYNLSFRQFENSGTKFNPLESSIKLSSLALNGSFSLVKSRILIGTEYNWGSYSSNLGFRIEFQKDIIFNK